MSIATCPKFDIPLKRPIALQLYETDFNNLSRSTHNCKRVRNNKEMDNQKLSKFDMHTLIPKFNENKEAWQIASAH